MRIVWRRLCVIAPCAVLLGACAASDFSKPVTDFSDAAKKAATSLTDYEKTLDQAAVDANISYALGHPSALRYPRGDCIQGAKRCRLIIRGEGGNEINLDPGPVDPRIRGAMAAVVSYVDNLKAIVTADNAAAIKSASDAAAASAINFAKAVDGYNAQKRSGAEKLEPQVSALAAPVSAALTYGLTQYAETIKVQALRRATTAMNQAMPEFMTIAGTVADSGLTSKRNQLASAFDNANSAFIEGVSAVAAARTKKKEKTDKGGDDDGTLPEIDRGKIVAFQNAAQAYDASLQLNASQIFSDLAEAHDNLTKAINEPEISLDEFAAILQRVVEGASKLNDISKSLQTASTKK